MNIRIIAVCTRNLATGAFVSLILSGCLMKDSEPKDLAEIAEEIQLSGSVGDGPIVGSDMYAYRNDGTELAQFQSTSTASYNVTIKTKGKYYPLTVMSLGGTDLVTNLAPDFEMSGAVLRPNKRSVANVNPFSTLIVALADELPGGASENTLAEAQTIVSSALNSGLDSLADSGPMTTHIDEHNIAEIVRASEALAETVRRTRDLLNGAGFPTTGDDVMAALASDLTDSVVNGQGGLQADARVAAVVTIVYAQVLMETMANELHVNGGNAQGAMSSAVTQVSVRTPTRSIDELVATSGMINRTLVGIAAAVAIDPDVRLPALHSAVSGIQPGMGATFARNLLPSDYRSILQNALTVIAAADSNTVDEVNQIASGDGDLDPDNQAPVIQGNPAPSVEVGSAYLFSPEVSDPEGDTLTFTIQNQPAWADFDAANGTLSGTPGAGDIGAYPNIVISVSDGEFSDSMTFSIEVFQGNVAPVISGTPQTTVTAGQSYVFSPDASDANGDTLTYSIQNQPAWASFNSTTGRLSGAPFESDVGVYGDIVITVSDGQLSDSLPAFSITVESSPPANSPPTISGSPTSQITAGSAYSFVPTADDPDGDTLIFAISAQPAWADFDPQTGALSGTPAESDVGVYEGILITVSDGQLNDSLPAFSITVASATPPNTPPTIMGDPPAEVNVGSNYSFVPTAGDADGDSLTFSISGQPSWSNFDTSSGALTGTPGQGDVGVYENIRISVSDGTDSASIEFSITVNAVNLGSATLSWTPPTSNDDGSQLTDLAGFKLYWGTTPGVYTDSVTINNPSVSTYVVSNLAPGSYEFVVTAFNQSGVESPYSNTATKIVP